MRIGIIIPSRPGREKFQEQCLKQMSSQTLQPTEIHLVDYPPESEDKDITQRYRRGYDHFRDKGFDVLALIENDDAYLPTYLEQQVNAWIEAGKPDLFGTTSTIYYHIQHFAYFKMEHHSRSSAMSTLIQPDLNFPWPPDYESFTDVWLYKNLQYKLWSPPSPICIGIKHGDGITGGNDHRDGHRRYFGERGVIDSDKSFLRANTTKDEFEFLTSYF